MRTKTRIEAGRLATNHNQTVLEASTRHSTLRRRTAVGPARNHRDWILEGGDMNDLCVFLRQAILLLFLSMGAVLLPSSASSQTPANPIPATEAFEAPACSDVDLGGIDALGLVNIPSPQRTNPEWKPIIALRSGLKLLHHALNTNLISLTREDAP